jgi:hypothetical protein
LRLRLGSGTFLAKLNGRLCKMGFGS